MNFEEVERMFCWVEAVVEHRIGAELLRPGARIPSRIQRSSEDLSNPPGED